MELTKNQKLWVEALRSGKYKQAVGVLESTSGGFCCLGVACKVAEEHGVEVVYDKLGGTLHGNQLGYQRNVQEWLGLINGDGYPSDKLNVDPSLTLSSLNDSGATFEEIADIIEQHPEWYFHENK